MTEQPHSHSAERGSPGVGRYRGKQGRGEQAQEVYNITSADTSLTEDQSGRIKNYTIQMVIRVVCFVGAFFADGWLRWTLVLGAVVLPYTAVVLANNTRRVTTTPLDQAPPGTPQLESGRPATGPGSGSQKTTRGSASNGSGRGQQQPKPSEVIEGRVTSSPSFYSHRAITSGTQGSSAGGESPDTPTDSQNRTGDNR